MERRLPMTSGFSVDGTALAAASRNLRRVADDADSALAGHPGEPDGGLATGVVADVLASLIGSVGNIAMDSREIADRLDMSDSSYAATDDSVGHQFNITR